MAGETAISLVGNVTAPPELRFLSSGAAVCTFTVASTPRSYDKTTNTWKDGEALFMRVTAWRQLAENIAENVDKGQRVIVVGTIAQRTFESKGEKRTVVEMTAEECGPSLKFSGTGGKAQRGSTAPAGDPWASTDQAPF